MVLLGLAGGILLLVAITAVFYYLFDSYSIDEEAVESVEDEPIDERAETILRHQQKIEEQKIAEMEEGYSGQ